MNKKVKKIVLIAGGAVLGVAAIWGGMIVLRNMQKEPAKVYAVSDFAMTDYWGDSSETSGMVTTDKFQKIMLSETQQVNEIYVQEGQTVNAGDALLSFDTTLSTLEVKKTEIELQRQKLQLTMAEKELKDLNAMKPYSSVLVTPPNDIDYLVQTPPFLIQGSGTEADPYYYLWDMDAILDEEIFSVLFDEDDTEEADETVAKERYVVLLVREYNALNGKILESYGLRLIKNGEKISMQIYQPDLPESILKYDAEKEPYYEESGSSYTAAELKQMRDEKAQEIADLKVSIKIAELEYKKMQSETEDGIVKSTITGTVKAVRDPDEAYKNGEAVIEVSGGGGYYVKGAMSELELDSVKVGQTVQINSWMTGTSCEGEIIEILSYPTTDSNSWSDGNNNVSYYPFRVFVEEDAQLQENDYVGITYQNQEQSGESLYLENMFIRTENGKSYVYIKNEKGVLEKRDVQTGRDLYGSYTQILGGITAEDYIAFPYGKDVFDGAKTKDATQDEFYSY